MQKRTAKKASRCLFFLLWVFRNSRNQNECFTVNHGLGVETWRYIAPWRPAVEVHFWISSGFLLGFLTPNNDFKVFNAQLRDVFRELYIFKFLLLNHDQRMKSYLRLFENTKNKFLWQFDAFWSLVFRLKTNICRGCILHFIFWQYVLCWAPWSCMVQRCHDTCVCAWNLELERPSDFAENLMFLYLIPLLYIGRVCFRGHRPIAVLWRLKFYQFLWKIENGSFFSCFSNMFR